jgi:hypothetical protein
LDEYEVMGLVEAGSGAPGLLLVLSLLWCFLLFFVPGEETSSGASFPTVNVCIFSISVEYRVSARRIRRTTRTFYGIIEEGGKKKKKKKKEPK